MTDADYQSLFICSRCGHDFAKRGGKSCAGLCPMHELSRQMWAEWWRRRNYEPFGWTS